MFHLSVSSSFSPRLLQSSMSRGSGQSLHSSLCITVSIEQEASSVVQHLGSNASISVRETAKTTTQRLILWTPKDRYAGENIHCHVEARLGQHPGRHRQTNPLERLHTHWPRHVQGEEDSRNTASKRLSPPSLPSEPHSPPPTRQAILLLPLRTRLPRRQRKSVPRWLHAGP